MVEQLVDYLKANTDNSGNWYTTQDLNQTRLKNFIKIQPYQLQFLPDGIATFNWLQSKIRYPIASFVLWLKQELLNRSYPIKSITYIIIIQGDLQLKFVLANNNTYQTIIPTNINE